MSVLSLLLLLLAAAVLLGGLRARMYAAQALEAYDQFVDEAGGGE